MSIPGTLSRFSSGSRSCSGREKWQSPTRSVATEIKQAYVGGELGTLFVLQYGQITPPLSRSP